MGSRVSQILERKSLTKVVVVDIGSLFVKFSLFASFSDEENYLIKSDIKTFHKFNYNLLGRELRRRLMEYSIYGGVDKILIIPSKSLCLPTCLPRFEYREEKKQLVASIKKEFQNVKSAQNLIFDWAVLADQPDLDYHSIVIDSIVEDEVYKMGSTLLTLGIQDFVIVSPLTGYTNLFNDNKAHLVIDIGDSSTRLAVVKSGVIYLTSSLEMGGKNLTTGLVDSARSTFEAMKRKHHSTYAELGKSVVDLSDSLTASILKICEDYSNLYRDSVADFAVVGGTAALDLEDDLNVSTIGIKRVYPRMSLNNEMKIPSETRNYTYLSYSTFLEYIRTKGNEDEFIDFMASKAGGIGLKIKSLVSTYNKHKTALVSGLTILFALSASLVYYDVEFNQYEKDLKKLEQSYKSKESSLQTQRDELKASLDGLTKDGLSRRGKNMGSLLEGVKSVAPPGLSIRKMNLIGNGEVTTFEVVSPSQATVTEFITLLQESVYGTANVTQVQVEKADSEIIYRTFIKAEGRKL